MPEVEHVGPYNGGGYDDCAVCWPEGGPVEGECYTHGSGDPGCRFAIDVGLQGRPLLTMAQRDALMHRFVRIDAEPRCRGERTGALPDRKFPREIRRMNPLMRAPPATVDKPEVTPGARTAPKNSQPGAEPAPTPPV